MTHFLLMCLLVNVISRKITFYSRVVRKYKMWLFQTHLYSSIKKALLTAYCMPCTELDSETQRQMMSSWDSIFNE